MKWTNRGHQLDELGNKYLKITKLYIWGAGGNGQTILNVLKWMKIEQDFHIIYCDSNEKKIGTYFCGKAVISAQDLCAEFDNSTAIIISSTSAVSAMLEDMKLPYFKFVFSTPYEHYHTNNFIQNFLCVWYMYKYGRLLSHSANYVTTTRCNLNCKGCLNLQPYIKHQRDLTFEEFKKHIDTVFSKYDFIYSFHFSGGECFLNKAFPNMLRYLHDRYGNRIYTLFCITNGTIIPGEELLAALKYAKCTVNVDDYQQTVLKAKESMPVLEKLLQNEKIPLSFTTADKWVDLALEVTDNFNMCEAELIEWHDSCNTYLQAVQDGKVYACCYEAFALTAEIINAADHLDITTATTMELLEYRLGYTESGYVELCKHCRGLGKNAVYIAPAEQIRKVKSEC